MGKKNFATKPFTNDDVKNRHLVINMLSFEEKYTKVKRGNLYIVIFRIIR